MDIPVRKEIMPGVFLTVARTYKFKTGYLTMNLLRPLSKTEASLGALLPKVLRRGTAMHPDMESISFELDKLYGARIEAQVRKKGEVQCVGFSADFVDDIYAKGDNLLEKVAAVMGEMLIYPATRGGRFMPEYVEGEKENLRREISSQLDDKRRYSLQRLISIMCAGESFGTDRLGTLNSAEAITGSRLFKFYADILAHSRMEVFYCGNAEFVRVESAVLSALAGLPSGVKTEVGTEVGTKPRLEPKFKSEEMDVSQCNLAMGLRTGISMSDELFPALMMFNALFGGTTASRLFMNVRERLSLCYYASSMLEKHKGVILVSAGIQESKFELARDEILRQMANLKEGKITDDEFNSARLFLVNTARSIADSAQSLEDFCLSRAIEGIEPDIDGLVSSLERVDKEEVAFAGSGIALDTTYLLKGASK